MNTNATFGAWAEKSIEIIVKTVISNYTRIINYKYNLNCSFLYVIYLTDRIHDMDQIFIFLLQYFAGSH